MGTAHPSSYNWQYGTFRLRRNAQTSAYVQSMIGLILSKRGQPGSVGFLKPSLAIGAHIISDTEGKRLMENRELTTVRVCAASANEDGLYVREAFFIGGQGTFHSVSAMSLC